MTMESLPTILFKVTGDREWYKNDSVLVDKTGIVGTIIEIAAAPFNESTILVDKTCIAGVTTEI